MAKQQEKKTHKDQELPPGAVGWTEDGRPVIPRKGETSQHAKERLEKRKNVY